MDLKSFQNSRPENRTNAETKKDDLRKTAEEYAQKSDADLLTEIMNVASKGKKDGTLSDEELRSFAQNVAPMLTGEQRERLQSVLEMIRRA